MIFYIFIFSCVQSVVTSIIACGIIGGFLFAIVGILGFKFKWFKHRLTFDQVPAATTTGSQEPQILKASFRSSCDFDSVVSITPPNTLPRKKCAAFVRDVEIGHNINCLFLL